MAKRLDEVRPDQIIAQKGGKAVREARSDRLNKTPENQQRSLMDLAKTADDGKG